MLVSCSNSKHPNLDLSMHLVRVAVVQRLDTAWVQTKNQTFGDLTPRQNCRWRPMQEDKGMVMYIRSFVRSFVRLFVCLFVLQQHMHMAFYMGMGQKKGANGRTQLALSSTGFSRRIVWPATDSPKIDFWLWPLELCSQGPLALLSVNFLTTLMYDSEDGGSTFEIIPICNTLKPFSHQTSFGMNKPLKDPQGKRGPEMIRMYPMPVPKGSQKWHIFGSRAGSVGRGNRKHSRPGPLSSWGPFSKEFFAQETPEVRKLTEKARGRQKWGFPAFSVRPGLDTADPPLRPFQIEKNDIFNHGSFWVAYFTQRHLSCSHWCFPGKGKSVQWVL